MAGEAHTKAQETSGSCRRGRWKETSDGDEGPRGKGLKGTIAVRMTGSG